MFDQYYDKITKIISVPEEEYIPHPGGLGCKLFECMKNYPENIAQIETISGKEDSYRSYLKRCTRTAIELTHRGIQQEDVIVLCSHNHLNSAVPFIAGIFLGIKVFSLDPLLAYNDIVHFLKLMQPPIIFASLDSEEVIENAVNKANVNSRIIIYEDSKKNDSFANFLEPKVNENNFRPKYITDLSETAVIVCSSGTTGMPKGVCLSHEYLLHSCQPRSGYSNVLTFSTLFWGSMIVTSFIAIVCGRTKILSQKFEIQSIWNLIEQFKVSVMFLTPYDAIHLYKTKKSDIVLDTPLKLLVIGGTFITNENLMQIKQMVPNTSVQYFYGQVEMFDALERFHPILSTKIDSVGVPIAGKSYKIVDIESGRSLGFNQRGELRIKSKWCTNGYYKQDHSEPFDAEGFLKTGDVAYYDKDFCFYIVERIKEMFKYKTYHIIPSKIEKIVSSHPDVKYVAVIGIPHLEDDNHAMAVVQLIENSTVTEDEIEQFANDNIFDYIHKLRGGVKIISEMPLLPNGKIKRTEVRKMFIKPFRLVSNDV